MRHRVVLVIALLSACVLTGCGSPRPSGVVSGDYRVVGGPAPGIDHPMKGTVWAYPGEIGYEQAMGTAALTHVVTSDDGRFELDLPDGAYTLLAGQGTTDAVGSDACGSPLSVTIRDGAPQAVHLVCSIP